MRENITQNNNFLGFIYNLTLSGLSLDLRTLAISRRAKALMRERHQPLVVGVRVPRSEGEGDAALAGTLDGLMTFAGGGDKDAAMGIATHLEVQALACEMEATEAHGGPAFRQAGSDREGAQPRRTDTEQPFGDDAGIEGTLS